MTASKQQQQQQQVDASASAEQPERLTAFTYLVVRLIFRPALTPPCLLYLLMCLLAYSAAALLPHSIAATSVHPKHLLCSFVATAVFQGVIACAGGISFGYEGPIVSGLIINPAFLQVFDDHSGSIHELAVQSSSYCKLNSPALQMYISCQFITAAIATAAAATWADRCVQAQQSCCRQNSLLVPGCTGCCLICIT
jgi:glycerol uptake facilitator-like aquaporin